MSTYCITFRIANETVGGKTYNERRQSLIDSIPKNNGYWEESTSFILTNSNKNTPDFADSISKGLSKSKDLLVVFDPSDMSLAYFGAVEHPEVLASFFNSAKKLP